MFSNDSIISTSYLIASKYSDKSLLSVIEECFEYGARSLYSDSPKPVPTKRIEKPIEELYSEPPTKEEMNNINAITSSVIEQAQEKVENLEEDIGEWSDSYSDFVVSADGLYEL